MTQRDDMQAAISDAKTIFVAQDADGHGLMLWPNDLKDIFAQLDAAEAREQQLKEAVETIKELSKWDGISQYLDRCYIEARDVLATLYPDTPAQPAATVPEITARPIDEWGEDYGDVLWWTFPIEESPYCGSPLDSDWPDYHTHWTPLVIPESPAPKEGE